MPATANCDGQDAVEAGASALAVIRAHRSLHWSTGSRNVYLRTQ